MEFKQSRALRTLRLAELNMLLPALERYRQQHGDLPPTLSEIDRGQPELRRIPILEFSYSPEPSWATDDGRTWLLLVDDPTNPQNVILGRLPSETLITSRKRLGVKHSEAELLWDQAESHYRTNKIARAYPLLIKARAQLERLHRTRPHGLNYAHCLAILNGRLFLMAGSLGDTNRIAEFLEDSAYYFEREAKEVRSEPKTYSSNVIEQLISHYDRVTGVGASSGR